MIYFYPRKPGQRTDKRREATAAGSLVRHPLPPSRPHDPHVRLEEGGWTDSPALMLRKQLPSLFCPRPAAHCPTITSRLVGGGSWKFPFAGQSQGRTISGRSRAAGPQGVGNFEGASGGTRSGASCVGGWPEGRSACCRPLRPGPCFGPTAPTRRSTQNHNRAGRSQTDAVTDTGCWLELHRESRGPADPADRLQAQPDTHNQSSSTEPPPSSRRPV